MKSKNHLLIRCLQSIDDVSMNTRLWIRVASLFLEIFIDIRDIMLERDGKEVPKN